MITSMVFKLVVHKKTSKAHHTVVPLTTQQCLGVFEVASYVNIERNKVWCVTQNVVKLVLGQMSN